MPITGRSTMTPHISASNGAGSEETIPIEATVIQT